VEKLVFPILGVTHNQDSIFERHKIDCKIIIETIIETLNFAENIKTFSIVRSCHPAEPHPFEDMAG